MMILFKLKINSNQETKILTPKKKNKRTSKSKTKENVKSTYNLVS